MSHPERQRYFCKGCQRKFDDLTFSAFSGHHQPLKIWVSCLHLMSLNISNRKIAQELDLNISDVQRMTQQLRQAICEKRLYLDFWRCCLGNSPESIKSQNQNTEKLIRVTKVAHKVLTKKENRATRSAATA